MLIRASGQFWAQRAAMHATTQRPAQPRDSRSPPSSMKLDAPAPRAAVAAEHDSARRRCAPPCASAPLEITPPHYAAIIPPPFGRLRIARAISESWPGCIFAAGRAGFRRGLISIADVEAQRPASGSPPRRAFLRGDDSADVTPISGAA